VLGVSSTHACTDGNSFYTMVHNWSRLCGGAVAADLPQPLFDQSLLPNGAGRTKKEAVQEALGEGWKPVSLSTVFGGIGMLLRGGMLDRTPPIHFSRERLDELKAKAAEEAERPRLTTNEALSAHMTKQLMSLHGLPAGTPSTVVNVLDCRERFRSVPPTFVGNLAFPVATFGIRPEQSLGEIARRLHDRLLPYREKPSTELERLLMLSLDAIRHKALVLPWDVTEAHRSKPTLTYVNNFSTLPIYDLDFGTPDAPSRPIHNIPHLLPDPVFLWPAHPSKGGIDVYLSGVAARAALRDWDGFVEASL
jgi:hypothetical protein